MLPVLASSSARSSCALENSSRLLADVDLRLGGIVGGLVRTLVDGEEQVALVDQRTVLEADLVQIAADPRTDGDLVDGLEAPDEFIVFDDFAHHRLGCRDHRQWLVLRKRHAAECSAKQDCGRRARLRGKPAHRSMAWRVSAIAETRLPTLRNVHLRPRSLDQKVC